MADRNVVPQKNADGTDATTQSMSAGQAMKAYILTTLEQPNTGIPTVITSTAPDFVSHLMTSQNNATHFLKSIEPMMSQDVSNIMAYGAQWKNFGPFFIKLGQQGHWSQVESGLNLIQKNMNTYMTHAQATAKALTDFTSNVANDAAAFSGDYTKIMSSESGIPAAIDALNKQVDAENKAITYAALEIAGGAIAAIGGIALCVAGGIGDIFSGGASTPLIVAGGVLVAGGVAAVTVGSIQIDKASHALAKAQSQISEYKSELSQLKSYSNVTQQLNSTAKSAATALDNLATTWDYLYEDMNAIIGDVKTARESEQLPWFEPAIQTTVDEWTQLNRVAENAQKQVADMQIKNVDMTKDFKSLLNALPKDEADKIRADEAAEVASRHAAA